MLLAYFDFLLQLQFIGPFTIYFTSCVMSHFFSLSVFVLTFIMSTLL